MMFQTVDTYASKPEIRREVLSQNLMHITQFQYFKES